MREERKKTCAGLSALGERSDAASLRLFTVPVCAVAHTRAKTLTLTRPSTLAKRCKLCSMSAPTLSERKAAMTGRIRVTVTLEPAVLRVFQRIADISGLSLPRTIGDWCGQTCDGAQVVAQCTLRRRDRHPSRLEKCINALSIIKPRSRGRAAQMRTRRRTGCTKRSMTLPKGQFRSPRAPARRCRSFMPAAIRARRGARSFPRRQEM
jgi:hypothetical protein